MSGERRRPGRYVHLRASWEMDPPPEDLRALELGRSRCADMLTLWAMSQQGWPDGQAPDLLHLLASCYLQGVRDTVTVLERSDWLVPGKAP